MRRFGIVLALAVVGVMFAAPAQAGGWWLQQYGNTTGTCDEGWSESWAAWFGDVCTRDVWDASVAEPVTESYIPDPPSGPTGWNLAALGDLPGSTSAPDIPIGDGLCAWTDARLSADTEPGIVLDAVDAVAFTVSISNTAGVVQSWAVEVDCG